MKFRIVADPSAETYISGITNWFRMLYQGLLARAKGKVDVGYSSGYSILPYTTVIPVSFICRYYRMHKGWACPLLDIYFYSVFMLYNAILIGDH